MGDLLCLKKESLLKLHKYLGSEPFGFKPQKKDLVGVLEKAEHLKEALEELKGVVRTEIRHVVPRSFRRRFHLSNEAIMINAVEAQNLMESVIIVKSVPFDNGKGWVFNMQSVENPRNVTVLYMIHDGDSYLFFVDRGAGTGGGEPLLNFE